MTTPIKKMSAIAAVINPVTEFGSADAKRVLLYTARTSNQTLALEQRLLRNNDPGTQRGWIAKAGAASGAAAPPSLANPSTLVALTVDSFVHVYGVLNDDAGTIALVSPVFQRLSATAATGYIAGSTDHNKTSWIFYETGPAGATYIAMKEVSNTADGDPNSGAQDINPGTRIDAVSDGPKGINWVLFQQKNKTLAVLNQNKKRQTDVSPDPKHFGTNTPLAITFVPAEWFPKDTEWTEAKPRGKLFVYWLDAGNTLLRSVAEVGSSVLPDFSEPEEASYMSQQVESYAQISVVADKDNAKNYIYTTKLNSTDDSRPSVIEDSWVKENK